MKKSDSNPKQKPKPINPYTKLRDKFQRFSYACLHPRRTPMRVYPRDKLGQGWRLSGVWERVAAAEQLGFDVHLKAVKEGLVIEYVEKPPSAPLGMGV